MAIRQSVLALYGAISEGLDELRPRHPSDTDPGPDVSIQRVKEIRDEALAVTGLTGSAGERGWYDELFSYFNQHRTGEEPVVPTEIQDVHAELSDDNQALPPTWANRAIAGAHVLDLLSEAGFGPATELPRFLEATIAASPAATTAVRAPAGGGSGSPALPEPGKVGLDEARRIAEALNVGIKKVGATFYSALYENRGNLDPAAALTPTIALRKVKREYCTVASTTAKWDNISYADLEAVIEPSNWSKFYKNFFCEMKVIGNNAQGWTRIVEAVSGDCDLYRLRTGLKFWKAEGPNGGLIINYDRDPDRKDPKTGADTGTDELVIVDNGYIWITPRAEGGVLVRTSKELLISGMSATAMTQLAGSMGYASSASDMFNAAAKAGKANMDPFTPSDLNDPATADTSLVWPTMIPHLPASLRDEMCRNTTEFTKERLDDAKCIAAEYAEDWQNGIDLKEYDKLADNIGAEVTKAAKDGFKMATSSFRPKPPITTGP